MSDWSDLNDEGVRLAGDGDVVGARSALEAALAASPPADRAQVLLNLAHVVDLDGDRPHAVELMTEAIATGEGTVRLAAIASRADLLPWLGRWEEAWRDVEEALADVEPAQQVVLRNTRVGLLMMAGHLAEAESEAEAAVELAVRHAPEYLENLYTNLALLADEAGDEQRAATYRIMADNPGRQPLGPRWQRFVELNTEGAVLLSSGNRAAAKAAFEAAYRETLTPPPADPPPADSAQPETPLLGSPSAEPPYAEPPHIDPARPEPARPGPPHADPAQPEAAELSDPSGTMKTGDPQAGTPAQQPLPTGDRAAGSPPTGDSAAGYLATDNPAAGSAPADDPPADDLAADDPAVDDPATGDLATDPAADDRATDVSDVEAVVCRAGVAGNLAGVADHPEDAVRWATEAIDAARTALAVVGDAYGSATVLVNALVSRAAARHLQTRLPEASADLAEAIDLVASADNGESFEATIRATRARVLTTGGWFAEAADEARIALDLAYSAAPELAATVHLTLAQITSETGDLPAAAEHLALARDLSAATGDVAGEATALLSSARLAYLASDGDRADAWYDEAEALLADDPRRRAVCLHGRAAVAVLRHEPQQALTLSDRARALLEHPTPLESLALHQVRGSAFEEAGRFAEAESCYAEATALCEEAGLWHVALGMAWWRADALVRRAATANATERHELSRRALDLALPAALASEAVRQRFPHGPLRERWVALASAPATRSAFLAIRAVQDTTLAAEYIDHIAGAVSLHAEGVTHVERGELVSLPEPPAVAAHLPYAAAGFATGDDPAFPATGFDLPPRVRPDPAVRTALDAWIDVAEQRYGFAVRSERAVASW